MERLPRSLEPVLVGFRISELMRGNVGNGFGMVLVPVGVVCVLLVLIHRGGDRP